MFAIKLDDIIIEYFAVKYQAEVSLNMLAITDESSP